MRVWQTVFAPSAAEVSPQPVPQQADLVLVFGSVARFDAPGFATRLTEAIPGAVLAGCSAAGETGPMRGLVDCRLHNRTMTVALLTER